MRRSALLLVLFLASCGSERAALPVPTSAPSSTTTTSPSIPSGTEAVVIEQPVEPCEGSTTFEHPPVDLDAVEYLLPFGLMTGSHVTPVDHHYFQNFVEPEREIEVYSPGSGRVVSIQHFGSPVAENREGLVDDFRLVIEHTCAISSIFIHIDHLVPKLAVHDPGIGAHASINVGVDTGELIGTFTANVDYNLVDLDFTTDGFVNPASYEREPWKIHVPDTFRYFSPEIRDQLENLSLRTVDPRTGRFAYDIDGRLVGNWFRHGTNGYGGIDPERYWAGHLSFAYDYLDPSMLVVSIGTFEGRSRQFAVTGNVPDPATVSGETGPVVYELVDWDYFVDGGRWDRRTHAGGIEARPGQNVTGVIAVRMVSDREILVDIRPGAHAADVTGPGPEAITFTR